MATATNQAPFDWGAVGMGLGLLPQLLKAFQGGGQQPATANVANPQGGDPNAQLNPSTGAGNGASITAGTGTAGATTPPNQIAAQLLGQGQTTTNNGLNPPQGQSPMSQAGAAQTANQQAQTQQQVQPATPQIAQNSNPLAALQKLATGTPQLTNTPGSSQPFQPATPAPVNYAGTGPNPALINNQLAAMSMAGSGGGAPLGPAAMNPLLALMRSRLGMG